MSKKEEFKEFAKEHKNLIDYVNSGEASWQQFYEMYDIYGENNSVWNEYQIDGVSRETTPEKPVSKASTVGDTSLKELFNMVKKIDLDSVRKGAEGLQKAIALVQDFGSSNKASNTYQARPLYKHLED